MLGKVGVYEFRTEAYTLDFRGHLTIPALGGYLLHAATCHAAERGYGYDDMAARNATWVLSRLAIEIIDRDRLPGPIKISTWVESVERIFTYRCFAIATPEGEALGYARSVWAAIDKDTRRPTSLAGIGLTDYVEKGRECAVAPFSKIAPAECGGSDTAAYKVKYSDLDINGHLNSIKYIEAMLDMFDIEIYRTKSVSRFEIMYNAEGRYGMELSLHKKEIGPGRYVASLCCGSKALSRAEMVFK